MAINSSCFLFTNKFIFWRSLFIGWRLYKKKKGKQDEMVGKGGDRERERQLHWHIHMKTGEDKKKNGIGKG